MLKDRSWKVRMNAATFLSKYRYRWCTRALNRLVRDREIRVRREAVRALTLHRSKHSLGALKKALTSDDILLRSLSAMAIGRIKGKRSRRLLRPYLRDPVESVRLAVMESLVRLKDGLGRKALKRKLRAKEPGERQKGIRILGSLKSRRWVIKALIKAIADGHCPISIEAARSLVLLGDLRGKERLLHYYLGYEKECRKLAARVMIELRSRGKWPYSKRCRIK